MALSEKKYVLALDQGPTSSRAILFDRHGHIKGSVAREFPQIYPREGWVEHDPTDIWSTTYGCMMEVIAKSGIHESEISSIGITNQRETTVLWNRETGAPLMNAIVWQCRRSAGIIEALTDSERSIIKEKTGLIPDAYFSAGKIKWVFDNVDGARELAEDGKLAFGTVDSWLIYKLTGEHATDRTNASRTHYSGTASFAICSACLCQCSRQSNPRPSFTDTRRSEAKRYRFAELRETSRRRCSGRPVSARVRLKTRTERDASC